MKINVSNREEFERLFKKLADDIIRASIHYRLHCDLRDAVSYYEREMHESRAFWSLTIRSHLETVWPFLLRSYDQHEKSLCLRNWLETINDKIGLWFVGEENLSDMNDLKSDLLLVSPKDPLVNKLIKFRGNLHAHRNAKNITKLLKHEELYPLSYKELRILVERAVTILNKYGNIFHHVSYSTTIIGHDDFQNVLKSVRESMNRHEEDIQEEMRRDGLKEDD